jgi:beta-carotene 3-hydroxylase
MGVILFIVVFAASFASMELVSYAAHRWLMHGPGMGWHASHHAPPSGRFEKNDRFPLVFSVVGVALFSGAALGAAILWPIATGVTVYGIAYLAVHEVAIHRRVPGPVPRVRYVRWLQRSHAEHHRTGGEPYGMLLPLRRWSSATGSDDDEPVLVRRSTTRTIRERL